MATVIETSYPEPNHFDRDAKQIVDSMFDLKLFKDHITRDNMNEYQNLIAYLLRSRVDTYLKCQKLIQSMADSKKPIYTTEKNPK